ncbi:hypothetical protein ABW21_db0201479 [Orbilia brochopaga]|nr:hypothetical protein ABW21_db0201479 [Drechslerella brochopaga]
MQFSKIIVATVAAIASVSAAPVPSIPEVVATAIGVACTFQSEQCQKVGDAVVGKTNDVLSASGTPTMAAGETGAFGTILSDVITFGGRLRRSVTPKVAA